MDSFEHDFTEELATAMDAFGVFLATGMPVPIDIETIAGEGISPTTLAVKLHSLIGSQPLPGSVGTVANGFVSAWVCASLVAYQLEKVSDTTVIEAAHEAYHWLLGDMAAALAYLNDWQNGNL